MLTFHIFGSYIVFFDMLPKCDRISEGWFKSLLIIVITIEITCVAIILGMGLFSLKMIPLMYRWPFLKYGDELWMKFIAKFELIKLTWIQHSDILLFHILRSERSNQYWTWNISTWYGQMHNCYKRIWYWNLSSEYGSLCDKFKNTSTWLY